MLGTHDFVICIAASGREDVLLTLPFLSDHAAITYAHRIEENWLRRCCVTVCKPNGFLVYQTDSRKRRQA